MRKIKTSKIVALAISLILLVNTFAGLSLTSFAASDLTVKLTVHDDSDFATVSTVQPGGSYTALIVLQNYNAANAATYPIAGLQIDTEVSPKYTVGFVGTKEKSGYSFDGTTEFATAVTESGVDYVRFASVYGGLDESGSFAYTSLASSESDIEIYAFSFTVASDAAGTIEFPVTVSAVGSDNTVYDVAVDAATVTVSTEGEPGWIWYPAKDSYQTSNTDATDSADGTYTTFTSSAGIAGDAGAYPGKNAGALDQDANLGAINADAYKYVLLKYKTATAGLKGEILALAGAASSGDFEYTNTNDEWTTQVVDMSGVATWTGSVAWFRFDALNNMAGSIDIEYVALFATEDEAIAWANATPAVTPNWAWYPAKDGYQINGSVSGVNSGDYTTFTVSATGVGVYTGTNSGVLSTSVGTIDADTNKILVIRYRTSVENAVGQVLMDESASLPSLLQVNCLNYTADGEWHDLVVDMSQYANWNGAANEFFRLDMMTNQASGSIDIEYVTLFATEEDANAWLGVEEPTVGALAQYYVTVNNYFDGSAWPTVGGTSDSTAYVFADAITLASDAAQFGFDGWVSTANGIAKYQYSLDGTTYVDIAGGISDALASESLIYGGADTAKFNFTLSADILAEGENTVTIRAIDTVGNWADVIKVNVVKEAAVVTYTITAGTCTNGTVSVDKTTAEAGDTVTVTATANDGYELTAILVDGTAITGNTFTVTGNHTVTATFTETVVEEETYTISVTVSTKGNRAVGGTAVADVEKAAEGDTVTITATAASNLYLESNDQYLWYFVESITVDGVAIDGTTFTMPAADVAVVVTFRAYGDINGDGRLNTADVTMCAAITKGKITPTAAQITAATVRSKTATSPNTSDTTILGAFVKGKLAQFPVTK